MVPFIALLRAAAFVLPDLNAQAAVVLTTLHSFDAFTTGAQPCAGLVKASDGYLYGTTRNGGANDAGTVFRIGTNGLFTTLYSFTGGNDGASPEAALVQGGDGSLYGTTRGGGQGGSGTVFRLTILPEFLAMELANGTVSLTWSTESGGTYQLQYSSDLSSSSWTDRGTAVKATGATLSTRDSITNGPRRFYRVVLLL